MKEENRVILPKSNLSTVSFALGLPLGAVNEPLSGITSVLLSHLQRNTLKMAEKEYADYLDKYGIRTFGNAGKTSFNIGMSCPPQHLDKAKAVFEDMILEPDFKKDTLQKLIQQQKGQLMQIQQMAQAMLFTFTRWKAAFGDSLLARSDMGTVEDLDKITVEELEKQHKQLFELEPKFASVGVDVTEKQFGSFETLFGKFGNKSPQVQLYGNKVEKYNTVVDKMVQKSMNSYLSINMLSNGHDVSTFEDAIFNEVLSGGFSGRMFTEIRDNRNLSYGPFSMNTKFKPLGLISAGMDVLPERSEEALKVTLELMRDVIHGSVDEGEMRRALKSAQRASVFVSDSSDNYTRWLIGRLNAGIEWDMEKEKKMLEEAAQSNWQEKMAKVFKPDNFTLGIAGEPGEAPEKFAAYVEEVVQ